MAKAIINGIEINKFVVDGGGIKIADGTKFGNSTWTEFPTQYHDYLQSCTELDNMFKDCILTSLDLSWLDTSNVTNMSMMFYYCKRLTSLDVSNWNTSNVTNMYNMFSNCSGLTSLDLSSFDTSNVTNMSYMFEKCQNIQSVQGVLNIQKITSSLNAYYFFGFSANQSIRKLTFRNFGYNTNNTSYDFTYIQNWGVNSDKILDAKQSLIDSLLTNSFDRASAGYSKCTISLHANAKARLTEDEIAQITAKGFTIA